MQRKYRREHLYQSSTLKVTLTIFDYVTSDISKRKGSFCIGTTTVFLVVMFLTALKSVIDIVPIAFLKVGQDQGGSIDISLSSSYPSVI